MIIVITPGQYLPINGVTTGSFPIPIQTIRSAGSTFASGTDLSFSGLVLSVSDGSVPGSASPTQSSLLARTGLIFSSLSLANVLGFFPGTIT